VLESELKELRKKADATLNAFQRDALGQQTKRRKNRRRARASARVMDEFSKAAITRVARKRPWVRLKNSTRLEPFDYARTLTPAYFRGQAAASGTAKSRLVQCAADQKVDESLAKLLDGKMQQVWPAFRPKIQP
jgi:hypothetical protein